MVKAVEWVKVRAWDVNSRSGRGPLPVQDMCRPAGITWQTGNARHGFIPMPRLSFQRSGLMAGFPYRFTRLWAMERVVRAVDRLFPLLRISQAALLKSMGEPDMARLRPSSHDRSLPEKAN